MEQFQSRSIEKRIRTMRGDKNPLDPRERKVLEATSRPTEYDAWKKAINEAEAALATQLPTED